jgi:hypothetical protein
MKNLLTICVLVFLGNHSQSQNSTACQNGSLKIFLNTADSIEHCVNTPYIPTEINVTDSFTPREKITLTYTSNVVPNRLGVYWDEYIAMNEKGEYNVCRRYVWIVDCSLGIQKIEQNSVLISANPTRDGILTISFLQPTETKKIELISSNGIVVAEISDIQMQNKLILPSRGFYFLRIFNSDFTFKTIKVVRID